MKQYRVQQMIADPRITTPTDLTVGLVLGLLDDSNYECAYCFVPLDDRNFSLDHIIPLSRGGQHRISNMQITCWPCNRWKGNRDHLTPEQAIFETALRSVLRPKLPPSENPQEPIYDTVVHEHRPNY